MNGDTPEIACRYFLQKEKAFIDRKLRPLSMKPFNNGDYS